MDSQFIELFVRTWNAGYCFADVCRELRMPQSRVAGVAVILRKEGHRLKRFDIGGYNTEYYSGVNPEPCNAPPGTKERVRIYAERVAKNQALQCDEDAIWEGRVAADLTHPATKRPDQQASKRRGTSRDLPITPSWNPEGR